MQHVTPSTTHVDQLNSQIHDLALRLDKLETVIAPIVAKMGMATIADGAQAVPAFVTQDTTGLWHSLDYRVCKDSAGTVHNLTEEVAKLIEAFNQCLKEGITELSYGSLLDKAKLISEPSLAKALDFKRKYPQRLDQLLRRAKIWQSLVGSGTKKGCYRLIL